MENTEEEIIAPEVAEEATTTDDLVEAPLEA